MYKTAPKEVLLARPFATEMAQTFVGIQEKQFPGQAGMALLMSGISLQTLMVSAILDTHEPGSAEGEKILNNMYESLRKDAIDRWHAEDLKHYFKNKNS